MVHRCSAKLSRSRVSVVVLDVGKKGCVRVVVTEIEIGDVRSKPQNEESV